MKTFTINGKEYKTKELDFNAMCDMEDAGVSLMDADGKNMSLIRAYFAVCCGKGKDFAGREIQQHMINGGNFDEISEAFKDAMENSDFFRALGAKAETEAATGEKSANEKK